MIKIVYFDNYSAIDYLNIYNGGEKTQSKEDMQEDMANLATKASAGIFAKLSWLPFVGGEMGVSAEAGLATSENSLIKTTLANTVLTDFLDKVKKDKRIEKFEGYKVIPYKNSIAFFKMFTPFLKITKSDMESEGFVFDISKLDEAFESGKGYYELIAEKVEKGVPSRCIFRFNIKAFRNNYTIADLTKMNLKYFATKVGSADESMLDIAKEFSMEQDKNIVSAFDLVDNKKSENEIDVYDVILAGVEK